MKWRWIVEDAVAVAPAAAGARNMATDAALLASIAEGAPPAIRLYRWTPACLSFGRNQAACGEYDPARIAAAGLDVVRRPTGGLAVLHDAELTYAVVAPARMLGGPREAYRRIHEAIARGLERLGIPTDLAAPAAGVAPGRAAPPCFAAPAGGEILSGGGKLVGSAQRTERRTFLQHGSILLGGSQARVNDLRRSGRGAPGDGSVTVAALLGRVPEIPVVAAALRSGFDGLVAAGLEDAPLARGERALAARLEDTYRDDAWTWRR